MSRTQTNPDRDVRTIWRHPVLWCAGGALAVTGLLALTGGSAEAEEPSIARGAPVVEMAATHEVRTDPVASIVDRIGSQQFQGSATVMTGRCLRDYDSVEVNELLRRTDLDSLRPVRRGRDWVFLEAPYLPVEDVFGTSFPWEPDSAPGKVLRLRLVEEGGEWKVEHMKVIERRI